MKKVFIIGKREFMSYFNSPIAYVTLTVFLLLVGLDFFFGFLGGVGGGGQGFFEANEASLRNLFEGVPVLLAIFLPAVSMRMISEEKKTGTMELLTTLPVRDRDIVLGKYTGGLLFLGVALALTLPYVFTVVALGRPDVGPIIGGYIGLVLIGAAYLAIGLLASTWTRNQIIAFIVAALLCTFLTYVDQLVGAAWEAARPYLAQLSFRAHAQNISRGVLDSRDIVFFISMIVAALMLSTYSLESRKWRA
jgi:ABC-2 type transport system permease protein